MENFVINNNEYKLEKDEFKIFDLSSLEDRITDYFDSYDYILGDMAYNKIRLKGFYKSDNKSVTSINDIKNFDNYLQNYCAYKCKWFLLKKIEKNAKKQ